MLLPVIRTINFIVNRNFFRIALEKIPFNYLKYIGVLAYDNEVLSGCRVFSLIGLLEGKYLIVIWA